MASRKDDKENAERMAEEPTRRAEGVQRGAARMASMGMDQAADFGMRQADFMRTMLANPAGAYRDIAGDGDMDAILQSGARLARGMQDVGWEMMQFSQQSLRMQIKAANDLMTCRSIEDMVQVQRDLVRESVDTIIQESARLLELSSNVATDALDPISQRAQTGGEQRH